MYFNFLFFLIKYHSLHPTRPMETPYCHIYLLFPYSSESLRPLMGKIIDLRPMYPDKGSTFK